MSNDETDYLSCKNVLDIFPYQISEEQTIQLIHPICPYCLYSISGFEYFQSNLNSERFHLNCFFKQCKANTFYIDEFYKDTLLPQITRERKIKWELYLQQQQQKESIT